MVTPHEPQHHSMAGASCVSLATPTPASTLPPLSDSLLLYDFAKVDDHQAEDLRMRGENILTQDA